jgi:hypothetical protein
VLTQRLGGSGPSNLNRAAGAAVDRAVNLVHGSMVDRGQGVNPRSDQGRWSWMGRLGMRAHDQAAADASGPSTADPAADTHQQLSGRR